MTIEDRVGNIEKYVPAECVRHDEQIKTICGYTSEIKDSVKWALRTTIGAVIVALIATILANLK